MSPGSRHKPAAQEPPARGGVAQPRSRREITSSELLGDDRFFNDTETTEIYTLRQTNKGKLILTK